MSKDKNRYILSFDDDAAFNAGLKAPSDCEKIFLGQGYKNIKIPLYRGNNKFVNKGKNFLKYLRLFKIKRGSIVAVQHPQYIRSIYMDFLAGLKSLKKVKIIFVVHDLESLRKMFVEETAIYQKLDHKMYQIADIIIAHNDKMKEYLVNTCGIPRKKIVILGMFDYLADNSIGTSDKRMSKDGGIVIAGNLKKEKSGYIYNLVDNNPNIEFNLYGVNWEYAGECGENWCYRGAFRPDELPIHISGSFGLVWDGPDIQECKGATGNYIKYNNPHKVSLYIAAGLPIIIWDQAALAAYIIDKEIGIAVSNLESLEEELRRITIDKYNSMRKNIMKLSEEVRNGKFTETAIKNSERLLYELR